MALGPRTGLRAPQLVHPALLEARAKIQGCPLPVFRLKSEIVSRAIDAATMEACKKKKKKACKKKRRKRRAGKEAVFVSTFCMSRMGRMGIINVVIIWGRVLIKLDAREVICNDEDKDASPRASVDITILQFRRPS